MENYLEFWVTPEGEVMYRSENGISKVFTIKDHELVEFILEKLRTRYPKTYQVLAKKYAASQLNKYMFNFRIADNFIRCNFGEHDLLTTDIDNIFLHFEEVRCPLRGICKEEGLVCKPKPESIFKPAEKKVVELYSRGFSMSEIAVILKKSANTINVQLYRIKKKLNLKKSHDIIKIFNIYNF